MLIITKKNNNVDTYKKNNNVDTNKKKNNVDTNKKIIKNNVDTYRDDAIEFVLKLVALKHSDVAREHRDVFQALQ